MDKRDEHSIAESGQMSEHAEYIQESTLMPETEMHIPETETLDLNTSGGLPGGRAPGVKTATAKKSFVKENMPFIVIGVLAAVIGGAFLFRPSQPSLGQPVVKTISQVERQAAPLPLPPVIETESKPQDLKGPDASLEPKAVTVNPVTPAPSAVVAPALIEPVALPPSTKSTAAKATTPVAPVVSVTAIPGSPSTPIQIKPTTVVVASNVPAATVAKVPEQKPLVGDQSLREALAISEQKLTVAQAELAVQIAKNSAQPGACGIVTVPHAAKPAVSHRGGAKKKKPTQKKTTPPLQDAEGFNVRAIKNGLAWVETPSGKTVTVRTGDSISGLGAVAKIDDRAMRVEAGGKKIDQR